MITYWFVYLGAVGVSLPATFLAARLARRVGGMDKPGARKVHGTPIPRIGGVGIAAATVVMVLAVLAVDDAVGKAFREGFWDILVLLCAALFVFAVGLADDIRGLRARHKLLAQLAAAIVVCAAGVRIDVLTVEGLFRLRLGWLGWPLTVFWIVGITNAINLIDGLDGLAAGISAVTCAVIAAFSLYTGQPVMAVLALAMFGALTGFLFFGFHPARIFLGDCGSLFLGFLLAGASVLSSMKSATAVGLALPMLAMGLPIFDTLLSMLRRLLERRSMFSPDCSHLHHRLLRMGLRQRQAVLILYGITLLTAGLGMFMMITRHIGTLLVFVSVVALLVLVLRVLGVVRMRGTLQRLQRNLALARQLRQAQQDYERARLMLREADGFQEWWHALCGAADELQLAHMVLTVQRSGRSAECFAWKSAGPVESENVVHMRFPCDRPASRGRSVIEIDLPVAGCLELATHRAKLFSCLADEHGPAGQPTGHEPRTDAREGVEFPSRKAA